MPPQHDTPPDPPVDPLDLAARVEQARVRKESEDQAQQREITDRQRKAEARTLSQKPRASYKETPAGHLLTLRARRGELNEKIFPWFIAYVLLVVIGIAPLAVLELFWAIWPLVGVPLILFGLHLLVINLRPINCLITKAGDFVIYNTNPARAIALGRKEVLAVETRRYYPTDGVELMGCHLVVNDPERRTIALGRPLSPADTEAIERFREAAGVDS